MDDARTKASRGASRGAGSPAKAGGWYVYILRCGDGTLYTGATTDPDRRLATHAAGRGAAYTRGRGPLAIVHLEPAADRAAALRRGGALQRLGRAGKEKALGARGGGG